MIITSSFLEINLPQRNINAQSSPPFSLSIKPSNPNTKIPQFTPLASITAPCNNPQTQTQFPLNDSTRTLKTLFEASSMFAGNKTYPHSL
ncbi:hypothetical protein E1A91_D12G194900v1 [Gossypium mustelinum]|uniref:Uncharacterized protein n=1 Tax=Gossypium mustelinum TaxID=34275 RepID=A0A5D2SFQ6_GOSMU|nr:hypothetical protein E1A91_D12G194900v1 [Gossypium mustelinum]